MTYRMGPIWSTFLFVLLAGIAAGCEGATESTPDTSVVSEFDLRTVSDRPLPHLVSTGDTLVSAQLSMRADQTFALPIQYRRSSGASFSTMITGNWALIGERISYLKNGDEIATGSYNRGKLTFIQERTYAFERR